MKDYIDRAELMKFPIRRNHCDTENANMHFISGIETVLEYADKLPCEDVRPVRHGRWIDVQESETGSLLECSVCKDWIFHHYGYLSNFCPNCGAQMLAIVPEQPEEVET